MEKNWVCSAQEKMREVFRMGKSLNMKQAVRTVKGSTLLLRCQFICPANLDVPMDTASPLLRGCSSLQSCMGFGVECPFLPLPGTAGRMEPPGYRMIHVKGRDGCPSRNGGICGPLRAMWALCALAGRVGNVEADT